MSPIQLGNYPSPYLGDRTAMATTLRRLVTSAVRTTSVSSFSLRPLSSATSTSTTAVDSPSPPNPRTRTPFEKEFESWTQSLVPGFTTEDVNRALRAQSDPDLALDIFRWTAQQRGYKHDHSAYLTIIQISVAGKRIRHAETLLEEVLAGACPMSTPLYNSMLRFCCSRRFLFKRAFDVYKRMYGSSDCRPDLETYTLLFEALLRRFNKLNVSYVYLRSVRSLTKQMKAIGVIPDTFVLNMIIKASSKCLEVDEAMRVFKEMGLYGCEPNAYSYSYLIKGLCEKERVGTGLSLFEEMRREKGLVPSSSTFMVLVCSLALGRRFEDAANVVLDMLGNSSMSPDFLTYRTLLDEMCRDGKGDDALELLQELRKRDANMGEGTYKTLLDALHFHSPISR
ncbi:hypothetical protein Dimus_016978 [Dionaea muscipula]